MPITGKEEMYVSSGGGKVTVSVNELAGFVGGQGVTSVNGETGDVIINAGDLAGLGALATQDLVTPQQIDGSTSVGQSVVTAANASDAQTAIGAGAIGQAVFVTVDQTTAREAIGAGTSNLAVGTAATDAKAGDWFPAPNELVGVGQVGTQMMTADDIPTGLAVLGLAQGPAVPDVSDPPTQAEVNALLASLRTAGIIATA